MKNKLPKNNKGFTLIEMIAVTAIIGMIAVGISTLTYWGIKLWNVTQDQIKAQDEARAAFQNIVGEIREMQISDNGSFDIESASANSLVFFSNVDSDPKREKVKYELQNGTLYRWYAESDTASPPQYPAFSDTTRTVIAKNIVNTGPVFQYYDDTYTGSSAPLGNPIQLGQVRLIKLHLLIDVDPTRSPVPLELETNVALRNLKDNL
jgi:prepilin-type N-terminal cleavage/methylation domain-containing protein